MDFIIYIILLLIGGCFGGLMAGLLGIGGGIILTPIQYFLLLSMGVDASTALPVSFATSLAVIFVTMLRSSREHYRNGFVETRFIKIIMVLGFIGAICGAFISTHINVRILEILFGLMCIIAAINMILIKYPDNDDNISTSKLAHGLLGLVAGLLCGLLGVGGGIIMIPILTIVLKYPTHKAIGTSSASIITTSLGGLIAYIILGWNVPGLPAYSLGYVNLIQFVFLTITSTIIAGYAANWSKKIDPRILKAMHIVLVVYIGVKMLGII
ncbi:MAG: sulfite exporter TauE/SafE family protein [Methanosphaera sp.]|uniref:sulfite exporter TauE/SafE family protein n=1 Tax=Methanosphaera TaxID=2316 RepID=UPI0023807493|nr:sulfite exporter TauE/SafE family protein [Candidatus Methanosphaera massiliense]MDD6285097.1 sulfite exporter TauE/SafE family protein [Methanobacteriaceae archaeon]MDE4078310.1 sulfite exporter TauE/SafE family protein [Candidatus Methanosphaera massiliense]MDY2745456.1 sulfite exporter TauE/SafE family protein [Methanosphaera sp.]